MKLLIAALLAVFSTSVLAEWTKVGDTDTYTNYVDLSTIRKLGNKVKMWNLYDLKVATSEANGRLYLSSSNQKEYDCKEETSRILAFINYSKNMGAGEAVYSSGALHDEPDPIAPRSVNESLFKLACAK